MGVGSSLRKLREPRKRTRTQHPTAVVELLIDGVRSRPLSGICSIYSHSESLAVNPIEIDSWKTVYSDRTGRRCDDVKLT
jgi:hypothetical protein